MGSTWDLVCPKCNRGKDKDEPVCDLCRKATLPASSHALVEFVLLKMGADVGLPSRENAQYDLLAKHQTSGKWQQFQVKTAYQTDKGVMVNTSRPNSMGRTLYEAKDVDVFALVWDSDVWLVPFGEVGDKSRISLLSSKYDKWKVV